MEYVNSHALDLLFMAIVLAVFAIAGLIYSTITARQAALGRRLLDACGNSYEVALQACQSVKDEHELLVDAVVAAYKKEGGK